MPDLYYAAACQTDFPAPTERAEIGERTRRMCQMVEQAVTGYEPFFDVRLVVFPEFAHAVPIYPTAEELRRRLAVEIPNEHTERYARAGEKIRLLHPDRHVPRGRSATIRTSSSTPRVLIGPEGVLSKYRKVNPWIPWEVHASPHDLPDYPTSRFRSWTRRSASSAWRSATTGSFPRRSARSPSRRRGHHPRVGVHGPVGHDAADGLVDADQPHARAGEHRLRRRGEPGRDACATTRRSAGRAAAWSSTTTAASWPRPSPGGGEQVVVAPIDIDTLRQERARRVGHDMRAHFRREVHAYMGKSFLCPSENGTITIDGLNQRIARAKSEVNRIAASPRQQIQHPERTLATHDCVNPQLSPAPLPFRAR